jgi:hypothetical protein
MLGENFTFLAKPAPVMEREGVSYNFTVSVREPQLCKIIDNSKSYKVQYSLIWIVSLHSAKTEPQMLYAVYKGRERCCLF